MGYALVFPGQGSQGVGMLADPAIAGRLDRLLDAAEALTSMPLRTFAAQGPAERLADTRAAQPLLFLADWAWGSAALEAGLVPVALAGHSLGELAALALAGVFSVEAGLELVVERSRLMATAAAAAPGTMAAVLGLDRPAVETAINGIADLWVANDNAPGQLILSGTEASLAAAEAPLRAAGARKVIRLAVSGAFHSPFMRPAADGFARLLAGVALADATIPVVQNVSATPVTSAVAIRGGLAAQITAPVRWTETMTALRALGADAIVECGPGSVLKGLARRMDGLGAYAVADGGLAPITEVLLP